MYTVLSIDRHYEISFLSPFAKWKKTVCGHVWEFCSAYGANIGSVQSERASEASISSRLKTNLSIRGASTWGGAGSPWDLKNTIFSGFLPLNYVIYIFEVCFLKLFAMWED